MIPFGYLIDLVTNSMKESWILNMMILTACKYSNNKLPCLIGLANMHNLYRSLPNIDYVEADKLLNL